MDKQMVKPVSSLDSSIIIPSCDSYNRASVLTFTDAEIQTSTFFKWYFYPRPQNCLHLFKDISRKQLIFLSVNTFGKKL